MIKKEVFAFHLWQFTRFRRSGKLIEKLMPKVIRSHFGSSSSSRISTVYPSNSTRTDILSRRWPPLMPRQPPVRSARRWASTPSWRRMSPSTHRRSFLPHLLCQPLAVMLLLCFSTSATPHRSTRTVRLLHKHAATPRRRHQLPPNAHNSTPAELYGTLQEV